ncbi:hypothetical protein Lepto7375DRAFT_1420 [Leptolyngbya sp. PCC 7375]|nr:hypothetical protein Lepto7375DRAFT_1420 [Leptolyngbya sp. PCC 7375]
MGHLSKTVKIIDCNPEPCRHKPRFLLSDGMMPAHETSFHQSYVENAFIPSNTWRKPTSLEENVMSLQDGEELPAYSQYVGIFKVTDSMLSPFENMGVSFAVTQQDCHFLWSQKGYRQAIENLNSQLSPFILSARNYKVHPLTVNAPGLRTVTYNREIRKYIGLHLDSWDKLPLSKRHTGTNRICLNLGFEDRYFLFVDLTLLEIAQRIDSQCPVSRKISAASKSEWVRQQFFKQYPKYPMVKVRVAPGEAYIAPTESIIHDGCTLGKKFADVILTIRGHLKLPSSLLPRKVLI